MPELEPTSFTSAAAFRAWLAKHHRTATELLVRVYRVHAGELGITYSQALDEALCYGWIDGVRRRLDEDSFSIRFTPRRPRSIWSRINVAHVQRLQEASRMTRAGLAAFDAREESRTGIYSFERKPMTLSPDLARRFRANKAAWKHFQAQAPWYRRLNIFRIMSAKRTETRLRRLDQLIGWSAKGKQIPGL